MAENRDVPGLAESLALEEAGWPQDAGDHYWCNAGTRLAGLAKPYVGSSKDAASFEPSSIVAAPTLGQMFAFCRERGIEVHVLIDGTGTKVRLYRPAWTPVGAADSAEPANALASAIAAAMRAEKGGGA